MKTLINIIIKKGAISFLTVTAILGGFFVAGSALATHTANFEINVTDVTSGNFYTNETTSNTYFYPGSVAQFRVDVNKESGDNIARIDVTSEAFSEYTEIVCPIGWSTSLITDGFRCSWVFEEGVEQISTSGFTSFTATAQVGDSAITVTTATLDLGYGTDSEIFTFFVDATSPITFDDTPEGWQTESPVTVNFTCEDGEGSGCAITKYTIDGSDPKTSGTVQTGTTISISEEGETLIRYYSIDNVDNEEDVRINTVQIDTEAPVTSDDVSGDWTNGNVTVTLTTDDGGVGSGIADTYYTTDGTEPTEADPYLEFFTLSDSGQYQLMYYSTDIAGNFETVKTGTLVRIDKDDPITTLEISPVNPDGESGWYITVPTITLTGDDQEDLSGYDKTYYRWGNSESFTEYTTPISAPEGDNTLYCYSTDIAGNQEVIQTYSVKVDTVNPTIINDASEGWQNDSVSFNLFPADTTSGIKEVRLDGEILISPYSIIHDLEGVFSEEYQVWDNAGNASNVGSYTVRIDLTSPVAGVNGAPVEWVNTNQEASVTCSDEGGSNCDEDSYKLYISTEEITECPVAIEDYALDNPQDIAQHSWVCSYAKDIAGNGDFSDSPVEFKVDQTPPTGEFSDDVEDGINALVDWQTTNTEISLITSDEGGSEIAESYLDQVSYGDTCNAVTPYTVPITISEYSTVCWRVVDFAGNENTGSSEILVDKIAPSVNAGSDKITNTQYTQDATVNDEDSGVAAYLWEKVSGPGNVNFGSSGAEDTTILADADGEYVIRLTATDSAGNSNSDQMILAWDTVDPNVEITTLDTVYKSDGVDLIFTPTDPVPGTALTCSYQVDNGTSIPVSCASDEKITETISGLSDGRRTITLTIIDEAGNSISEEISLVIDLDNNLTVGADADFTIIQAAIDAASPNDTIQVTAGAYNEDIAINKSVDVIGSDRNTTIINGSGSGIVVNISSSNVTFSGFTVTGSGNNPLEHGAIILYGVTGCVVENNIVTNNTSAGIGLRLSDNNTVQNNTVSNNYVAGIALLGSNNNIVDGNEVSSTIVYPTTEYGYGIVLDGVDIDSDDREDIFSTGNTINNNTFSGNDVDGIYVGWDCNENDITNNIITDNDRDGVYFWKSGTHTVTGNTITGSGASGIQLMASQNNTITQNIITGNNTTESADDGGILIRSGHVHYDYPTPLISNGNIINENTISGNANYNIIYEDNTDYTDDDDIVIDAEENYWGTAVFATIQSLIGNYERFSFEPYYIDDVGGILSNIDPDIIYINDDYTDGNADGHYFGYDAFATIQEGINATAEDGILYVAAGTYTEIGQIVISKNLSIVGADKITTVIKPDQNTVGNNVDTAAWILVNSDKTFNLSNVTLDGDYPNHLTNWGIASYGFGTIDNIIVKNIKSSTYLGRGIVIFGNMTIANSTFENIERIGIHVRKAYSGSAIGSATITDNTYVGKGDGDWLDYGIEIGAAGIATISNNIISDCSGVASTDDSTSAGILITDYYGVGTQATISGNTITNCTDAIAVGYLETDASVVMVQNNKFSNNEYGVNSTGPVVNATQNWWGHQNGPQHSSNLGSDITADAVSDNVNFRPWYTNADLIAFDITLPTVTIDSLLTNDITPILTGTVTDDDNDESTADDSSRVEIMVTVNEASYVATNNGDGVWTAGITGELAEGIYNISVTAEDIAGNISNDSTTNELEVDITSPTAEVSYSTTELTNENVIATIVIDEPATVTNNEGSETYVFTGNGSFEFIFADFAGNGGSVTATVSNIDKTAPTGYSATIDGDYVNADNQTVISFTFTGAEENAIYNYSIDDANIGTAAIEGDGTITTAADQITGINVSALDDDILTLTVYLTDPAENKGEDIIDTIIKDTVAPSINVSSIVPSDMAMGVDPTEDIVVSFDEEVIFTDSNIDRSANIDVSGSTVTITPTDLANNTEYTITLTGVTDLAGNVMSNYEWSFTTATRYEISLETGWNLISLPVTPTTWASTTEVLASASGSIERVWSYDAVAETWSVYNANGAPGDLNTMIAGRGYWIKTTNSGNLTGVGTLYEQFIPSGETYTPSIPPQIPLATGWNMIGYYQLPGETTATLSNALSTLNGAWTGSDNHLMTFTKGSSPTIKSVSMMNPGEGYWIFMTDDRPYTFGSDAK
jgi:parallel beta-helix repeat protein